MLGALTSYFAASCSGGSFLGFPTWYHYLPGKTVNGLCSPQLNSLSDIWLIVAAIIEVLLRIAGMAAVVFVIIGAINYITSQGEPGNTAKARDTIVNALIGLAIAVMSAAIVAFLAGHIK
jgi:Type IV secretion system pilin